MRPGHWLYTIPLRLRSLFGRAQADQELDDELGDHLERKTEEYVAKGMAPGEARRRARLDLDGVEKVKEECRDARRVNWIQELIQDLRFGLRMLRRSPGFTAATVLSLALGLAATSVLFSILDGAYIHFGETPQANRVVLLTQQLNRRETQTARFAPAEYFDIASLHRSFDGFFALDHSGAALTEESERGENPEQVPIVRATANIFSLYGVSPLLGRTFTEDEDRPGGTKVAVVTYRLWNRRFGRNPGIVGRTIKLDGVSYTVVGISPRRFQHWGADIYIPLGLDRGSTNRSERALTVAGVLKEGLSAEQAVPSLRDSSRRVEAEYGATNPEYRDLVYVPFDVRRGVVGDLRTALYVLLGAVAFLLLIAAANVANLLLVRTLGRAREISTRLALGAKQSRLARQFFTESVLLSIIAGGIGSLLGIWALAPVIALIPAHYIGEESEIHASPSAFFVSLAVALVLGMAFSTAPSLFVLRRRVPEGLGQTRSGLADRGSGRIRTLLVACEMALAFLVVTGAGLMLRTYRRITTMDMGFQPAHVLTMRIALPNRRYRENAEAVDFVRELLNKVRALPGVLDVAASTTRPLENNTTLRDFSIPGRLLSSATGTAAAVFHVITPTYFTTIRTPLRAGRFFSEQDNAEMHTVSIVNEKFAQLYFPNESAVGKQIRLANLSRFPSPVARGFDNDIYEIVGVVGDSRHFGRDVQQGVYEPPSPEIFVSLFQHPERDLALLVRTELEPDSLTRAVTMLVHNLRADQPIFSVQTLDNLVDQALGPARLCLLLLGVFAATALVTACVGLYAIASYGVTQRTQEIGVRMALGADRRDIARLVTGEVVWPVAAGLGAGLLSSLAATRLMSNLLYGVASSDLATLTSVSAALTAVAIVASYIPARRAMRADPMFALRYE